MESLPNDDEVTSANIAQYVNGLAIRARSTGPKSILDKPVVILHGVVGFLFFPLILIQGLTTLVLGFLVSITFGLLLIPISVLWWPFLAFLLASS